MKAGVLIILLVVIGGASSSWLADVFSGLTEPLDDNLKDKGKDIWGIVKGKVTEGAKAFAKDHKDLLHAVKIKVNEGAKALNSEVLNSLVKKGSDLLEKVEASGEETWKEEKSNIKEKALQQWTKLIQKVVDGKKELKLESVERKFRKLHEQLKTLIPEELYKDMVAQENHALMKWKNNFSLKDIEEMKNNLNEHVKTWEQPSFLKNAFNKTKVQDIQRTLQDVKKDANTHVNIIINGVAPIVKEVAGDLGDKRKKEEKKIEKFVGDFFKKPHTESGTGPWEGILGNIDDVSMKNLNKNDKISSYLEQALTDGRSVVPDSEKVAKELENEKASKSEPSETSEAIFTGNENWDIYKMYENEEEKPNDHISKSESDKFAKDLSDVTSHWVSLKKDLSKKMNTLEKLLKK